MQTKLYLPMMVLALAIGTAASAKIWRVNNNGAGTLPVIAADFTTLQAAHDGAAIGDTLHIEQSPTSYGNCTFTKRLVVIGAGYFLTMNPKTQVNKGYGSPVGQLVLQNAGSAGTVIMGLSQVGGNVWFVGANNVTLSRNYFTYTSGPRIYLGSGTAAACDGINLLQNFVEGSSNTWAIQTAPSTTGNITSLNITGNIITGVYGITLGANASGILKNNTFNVSYNPLSLYNFYVVNNMAYSYYSYPNAFENSNLEFNMGTIATHFVTVSASNTMGSGNQTVAFASWNIVGGTASTDGYYQLQASSPAKAAGKNSDDIGAFGSMVPYKLSGIASVPNVYAMTVAPINPGASSISVTVSAKSNN